MARAIITIDSESDTLKGWAKRHGVDYSTVKSRWRAGWPIDQLFVPLVRKYSIRVGTQFGRWTVIEVPEDRARHRKVKVRCECGTEKMVALQSLRNGDSKSCGCWNRDLNRKLHTRHLLSNTPEYRYWQWMKRVCYNPRNRGYCDYGAKGITVHDNWRYDFQAFLDHVGRKPPGHHLIRIDRDRPFEPGNVRWSVGKENLNTITTDIDGITLPLTEWATISGVKRMTVWQRYRRDGWSAKNAVFTPPGHEPGDYDVMAVFRILKKLREKDAN